MQRTALITGAYGYLGSVIRARLDVAGWNTVALVRKPRPQDQAVPWKLGELPPLGPLETADALVHCAYDFEPRARADVWRTNVDGWSELLQRCKQAGVERVLALSSMSAYDGTRQTYGLAKLAIEETTIQSGGIAVRPGLVYGDNPGGMVGSLAKLFRLPVVPVPASNSRQFPVHQNDLAEAVVTILESPGWSPEAFGIAEPQGLSFLALLTILADREGRRCRFLRIPWRPLYWALRLAEATPFSVPFRSDSLIGLVRPAPSVQRSKAFPAMLEEMRTMGSPAHAVVGRDSR